MPLKCLGEMAWQCGYVSQFWQVVFRIVLVRLLSREKVTFHPMKKPTKEYREWQTIHIHCLNKRIRRSDTKKTSARKKGKSLPSQIQLPEDFLLESNFENVIKELYKIRGASKRQRNEEIFIDFKGIRKLSPATALVLAAELYRWNHTPSCGKLTAVDTDQWDTEVRGLLNDMGFFELLQINRLVPSVDANTNIRYIKFKTGNSADGRTIADLLKDDLEASVGRLPMQRHLYAAISEAITNVVQHAYGNHQNKSYRRCWWLSASYDYDERKVSVMVYDQGVGIPRTLPPELIREKIMAKTPFPERDATLIQKAHQLYRTASKKKNRGVGMRKDMRGYMEKLSDGYYKVTSLKGVYTFKRLDGKTEELCEANSTSLEGTLIEWSLSLEQI